MQNNNSFCLNMIWRVTVIFLLFLVSMLDAKKCKENEVCVEYYQCRNGKIVTDGSTTMRIRIDISQCNDTKVCCELPAEAIQNKINNNDKFPWMAAIYNKTTDGRNGFICGGSLIKPRVILTASHCLDQKQPQDIIVVVNGKEKRSFNTNAREEIRKVSGIVRHPKYNSASLWYDVALLILETPFVGVKTLPLPNGYSSPEGNTCLVAGWGEQNDTIVEDMKKLELPMVEHSKCQTLLRDTIVGPFFILDRSFLCAGGEEGKDACVGDGGSPLICKSKVNVDNFTYKQVGIVSWGVECGMKNVPGIYVDVDHVQEWIENEISNNT